MKNIVFIDQSFLVHVQGVITKSDADETFNIKDFIQSAKLYSTMQ